MASWFLLSTLLLAGCASDPGLLKHPKTEAVLHWPKEELPLIVTVDPSVAEWAYATEQACVWWNQRLGFNAFLYMGIADVQPGVVPVIPRTDGIATQLVTSLHGPEDGTIMVAYISVPWGGELPRSYIGEVAMRHELGHVLGLDHDPDNPHSVMRPSLDADTPITVWVTDSDLKLLRETYE